MRPSATWWPTLGVVAAGLVATTTFAVATQQQAMASAQERLERRALLVQQAVQSEVDRYEDALVLVAAAAGSTQQFSKEQFDDAVEPLHDMELSGATSIVFLAPPVDDDRVGTTERYWRSRGVSGLRMAPSDDVDEHIFSIMSEPLDGSTQVRTGIDVAAAPAPTEAMLQAAATNRPTITTPYVLIIDEQLPPEQRQQSFSMTVPVRHDGQLRGWVLMGIRGQDFAGGVLARAAQGVIDARLTAEVAEGRGVQVASVDASYDDPTTLRARSRVEVAQRTWTVTSEGNPDQLLPYLRWSPGPQIAAGLLITLLLGMLVQFISSRRSLAETRAREASEQLAGVTTRLEDLIWSAEVRLDGTMALVFANTATVATLGVRAGDDLAARLRERTFEEDLPVVEEFLAALELGDPAEVESRMVAEDGTVRWTWSRGFARRDGATLYVDGITSDVHRRKRLDQQRSQFLAIAGHEMRTPLTIIRGYAEFLLADDNDPGVRRHGLEAISRRSRQMESLLSDFFDLSRLETGMIRLERHPLRLDEIVRTAREDFHSASSARGITLDVDWSPAPIVGDPVRVRQVVDNLVDNAVKYSRDGGVVRVRVGTDDGSVRLVVSDDGIGVPQEEVSLIFDRFFRASNAESHEANGTGLGLSVVAAIVHGHGGRIVASSPPGEGLTVTVTLPAAVTAAPVAPAADLESEADQTPDDLDEGAMMGA